MGWITTYKPKGEPVLDFFIAHGVLTWGDDNPYTYKVLDIAIVKFNTFYAAVEQIHKETGEKDRVWAAVILIRHYNKKGGRSHLDHNFGWKDMDESCGPSVDECPERILKLLTPTDSGYANDWRKRCWANIERRKAHKNLPEGTVLKYGTREYTINNEGRAPVKNKTWVTDDNGQPWLMKHSQILAAEIMTKPVGQAETVPASTT